MVDNDIVIWIRGWEDTFTATGKTIEECHDWLKNRMNGAFAIYVRQFESWSNG
jgi:hypothetical protein